MKRITLTMLTATIAAAVHGQTEATADTTQTHELHEVVVKAEKPQVKVNAQDGAMIVDLPEIVKNKPVTNIYEALSYAPGVTNTNGHFALAGAQGVAILINGEPTTMPLANLYQLLYATPVDRLKNIEIMYSAPAKYHAGGAAVINIVLKSPRPLDGLMGQVQTALKEEHYTSQGLGLSATYALKDWKFETTWSLERKHNWKRQITESNHLIPDGTRQLIDDNMTQINRNTANTLYASAAYKKLKLSYNGQFTSDGESDSHSFGTLGTYTNFARYTKAPAYNSLTARYEAPFGLAMGGSYTHYSEGRRQNLMRGTEQRVDASTSQNINRYHVYADQTLEINKWNLSFGLEYQHSNDHSRQTYVLPESQGFDSRLREDVASGYVGLQGSLCKGLSLSTSLKEQYFHNDFTHRWNFIPQLGMTYYTTPSHIMQLNVSSQQVYPSYWQIHGGSSYINDYSMVVGNPNLQPYISYNGNLSYIFKQKYVATAYISLDDDYSVQLPYQSPKEMKLIFQTINLNYQRKIGVQLMAPFKIAQMWDTRITANIYNQREKADKFHDISFDNNKLVVYSSLRNTFKPSATSPLSFSLDMQYLSPSMQGIADISSLWRVDAGAKWLFGKKRCCELTLSANDIFDTWSPTLTIDHAGQDYRMRTVNNTRSLKLGFAWRFNGFKPKNNDSNPDTSRFGTN